MRQKVSTLLFYVGLIFEIVVSFSGYAFGGFKEPVFIFAGMAFFALSICFDLELKKMWPWYAAAAVTGAAFYYFQHQALILRILLPLLAGRKQNVKKVVRLFFWGTLAITVCTAVLSFFGKGNALSVTNVFRHEEETRYQFGFIHPNAFAFFWFRIILLGLYGYNTTLQKGVWKRVVYYGIAVLALLPLYFAYSKTALVLSAASIMGVLLCDCIPWKGFRKILLGGGGLLMTLEIFILYSSMTWFFLDSVNSVFLQKVWWFFNNVTTGRTHMIHTLYERLHPAIMGTGIGSDGTEVGFVNALYNQGIIFIVIYVCILGYAFYRMYKEDNKVGMILILAFTFYASAEPFLPYFNKNGVWLMLIGLCYNGYRENQKGEKDESSSSH